MSSYWDQQTGRETPWSQYYQSMVPYRPYDQSVVPSSPYGQPAVPSYPYGQPVVPLSPYGQSMGPFSTYDQSLFPRHPATQTASDLPLPSQFDVPVYYSFTMDAMYDKYGKKRFKATIETSLGQFDQQNPHGLSMEQATLLKESNKRIKRSIEAAGHLWLAHPQGTLTGQECELDMIIQGQDIYKSAFFLRRTGNTCGIRPDSVITGTEGMKVRKVVLDYARGRALSILDSKRAELDPDLGADQLAQIATRLGLDAGTNTAIAAVSPDTRCIGSSRDVQSGGVLSATTAIQPFQSPTGNHDCGSRIPRGHIETSDGTCLTCGVET